MKLILKTNRNDFITFWIPFLLVFVGILIADLVYIYGFNGAERTFADNVMIIICSVVLGIAIITMLLVKFVDRQKYIFTNENIRVFKRKNIVNELKVEDIVSIKYVRFIFRKHVYGYGVLDGEDCGLYVGLKNGNLMILGRFSKRDAKKIKNLYGDLVEIV